jgi:predicted regulator of Ras-like GTPase activity (Roadblock/LC7/MglB family)
VDQILQRLMEIEGVTGVLLVGKDGLVVASAMDGEDEEFLAAMAAACYDAAGRYIDQLGMGEVRHAMFETPGGTIQVTDGGDLLIVVRSTYSASIGRVRMESGQAALRLAEQIASY